MTRPVSASEADGRRVADPVDQRARGHEAQRQAVHRQHPRAHHTPAEAIARGGEEPRRHGDHRHALHEAGDEERDEPAAQVPHEAEAQQHRVPEHRVDEHGALGPSRAARHDEGDRAHEGAQREAGDQPAEAGRVHLIDLARNIGQEAARDRVGGQVDEEREPQRPDEGGRAPHMQQALDEVTQARHARGGVRRRVPAGHGIGHRPPPGHPEREHHAHEIEPDHEHVRGAEAEGGEEASARERADHARRVHGGAGQAERAHEIGRRDGLAHQDISQHLVVGAHEAAGHREKKDPERAQPPGEREHSRSTNRRVTTSIVR